MKVSSVHDFETMKNIFTSMSLLLVCGSLFSAVAQERPPTKEEENEERHFEMLTVGALTFTNVWVHRQTNAVILIRHSMGIHSIKLSDLPAGELAELKSQVGEMAEMPATEKSGWKNNQLIQKLTALLNESTGRTKIILGCVAFLMLALVASKMIKRKSSETV